MAEEKSIDQLVKEIMFTTQYYMVDKIKINVYTFICQGL